jgi:hypothetical protein
MPKLLVANRKQTELRENSQLSITGSFITGSFHVLAKEIQSIIYEQFGGEAKVNVDVLLNNYFSIPSRSARLQRWLPSTIYEPHLDRFTCFLLFVPPSFSFVRFECV